MRRALLDVNVLIALLDAAHAHHAEARNWLASRASSGWASCPLTENGCVRVMSQPAYPNSYPAAAIIERLATATRHPSHEFWPADISLLDASLINPRSVQGPRQITDLYLLAVAVRRDGCFATFDKTVSLSAVPSARPHHLVVI